MLPIAAAAVLGAGLISTMRRHTPGGRPWWGNPWLWVGVCGISLVLGLLVWPGLFGGVFVFLPFVWIRTSRRRPTSSYDEGPPGRADLPPRPDSTSRP